MISDDCLPRLLPRVVSMPGLTAVRGGLGQLGERGGVFFISSVYDNVVYDNEVYNDVQLRRVVSCGCCGAVARRRFVFASETKRCMH